MTSNNRGLMDEGSQFDCQKHTLMALKLLAMLSVIYTLYFARTLLLPMVLAGFMALFLSPLVRMFSSVRVPRALSSLIIVILAVAVVASLLDLLVEPASRWLQSLPAIGEKVLQDLERVPEPLNELKETVLNGNEERAKSIKSAVDDSLLSVFSFLAQGTFLFMIQIAAAVIIIYFFLAYGEDLMRNVVRAQDSFSEKKMTVVVFEAIREDVSRYVLVVSMINIGLGVATATVLALAGVKDALLWGTMATVLNFAPYIGPIVLMFVLAAVGYLEYDTFAEMAMVPGLFFVLNLTESQFITPTLLGHRFNMNPLLIVLWMFACGWFWGAIGILIAIPILMCFKIIAKHTGVAGDWVKVIDGHAIAEKPVAVDVDLGHVK